MNGGNWIALASLAGFVLVQTATIAFLLGGLFAKVKMLEARPHDDSCATQLAAMTARLGALKEATERSIGDLSRDIHSIRNALMRQPPKQTSRRTTG